MFYVYSNPKIGQCWQPDKRCYLCNLNNKDQKRSDIPNDEGAGD